MRVGGRVPPKEVGGPGLGHADLREAGVLQGEGDLVDRVVDREGCAALWHGFKLPAVPQWAERIKREGSQNQLVGPARQVRILAPTERRIVQQLVQGVCKALQMPKNNL